MKKLLLTATFVVATFAAASAIELKCNAPQMLAGEDATDTNPVVMVDVRHDEQGWLVKHYLRNGEIVSRNDQYAISDMTNSSKTEWQGILYRNSKLFMTGTIKRMSATGQLIYVEELFKLGGAGGIELTMQSSAGCLRAPEAPPVAQAPAPRIASRSPSGKDSVPIVVTDNGRSAHVDVLIGGMPLRMLIDTGASSSTVPLSFARMLVASGQAVVLGDMHIKYADGRVGSQKAIRINELQIGNHIVRNVLASVSDGPPLLSFPAINSIAPFTIDTRAGELIWHTTRG